MEVTYCPVSPLVMAKAIREASGKRILAGYLDKLTSENGIGQELSFPTKTATFTSRTNFKHLAAEIPWLETKVKLY